MNLFRNILKCFTTSPSSNSIRMKKLEEIEIREQKRFTYEALVKATNNFHHEHKLGEGGFGPVYKGKLNDGREIAVKKLSQSSRQGNKEFENEAKLLSTCWGIVLLDRKNFLCMSMLNMRAQTSI